MPSTAKTRVTGAMRYAPAWIRSSTISKTFISPRKIFPICGGFSIFDEDFLSYLENFRFSGDIYAIPEGTLIFPREPLIKVIAPIMEAQLVETADLKYHKPPEPDRHKSRPCRATPPVLTASWNLA